MILFNLYFTAIIRIIIFTFYIRDVHIENLGYYTLIWSIRMLWARISKIFLETFNKYLTISNTKKEVSIIMSTCLSILLILMSIFFLLIILLRPYLYSFLSLHISYFALVVFTAFFLFLEPIEYFFLCLFRATGQEIKGQLFSVLGKVLGVLVFFTILNIKNNDLRVFNIFIWEIATFIFSICFYMKNINILPYINFNYFSWEKLRYLFADYYLGLFLFSLANAIRDFLPILVLSKLGFYIPAAILVSSINLIRYIINISASSGLHVRPLISFLINKKNYQALNNIILPYMRFFVFINTIILIIISYLIPLIINIWYPNHIGLAHNIFQSNLLSYTFIIYCAFPLAVLYVANCFKKITVIYFFVYFVTFLIGAYFVKKISVFSFIAFYAMANFFILLIILYYLSVFLKKQKLNIYIINFIGLLISSIIIILNLFIKRGDNLFFFRNFFALTILGILVYKIIKEKEIFLSVFLLKEKMYKETINQNILRSDNLK